MTATAAKVSLFHGKTLLWMLHFGSWTLSVTVCNKDKEISDVKNLNSLYLLSFPQTLENWSID